MKGRLFPVSLSLACLAASTGAFAAAAGSAYFRYDKVRLEIKHAYAVVKEERSGPNQVYLFLTSDPLDAKKVADAFDPGSEVNQQMNGKAGGYVHLHPARGEGVRPVLLAQRTERVVQHVGLG